MLTHILVIEDEQYIRENLAELLELNGYKVETAEDGMQGLAHALLHQPDLILCDIQMPQLDGYEVLKAIRSSRSLCSTPFLFLTAKTDMPDMRQGMAFGADDYLTKPFTSENLLLAIESRLQREGLRKADLYAQMAEQHQKIAHTARHEYNTPLSGIMGFASLLIDHYDEFSGEDTLSMLEMIRNCSFRLKRSLDNVSLINSLQYLDPSHSEYRFYTTGQTGLDSGVIERQISAVESRQEREVNWHVEVSPAEVAIGEENLRVVLDELLDNAVKFSNPDGSVTLTGRPTGDVYRFTVSNGGRLFKAEDIAQIAPYRQFDRKQYEQQGFGLGLAIIKKLIELNRGSLEIESSADEGTRVMVQLPLA